MKKSSYWTVAEKSRAACVAAVETYNRASALYREETFAILMINAWELLLKARVLKENKGKRSSIYSYEARRNKDGKPGKSQVVRRSRSKQPLSINITRAYNLCAQYAKDPIDQPCIQNIEALLEIRDLAIHFVSRSPLLAKTLGELAMAAVKNYVIASQKWFGVTYSDLNIASIPLSFHLDQFDIEAAAKSAPAHVLNFLRHVRETETALGSAQSDFAFTVYVNFDLIKKKTLDGLTATIVAEGGDITVNVDDNKIPQQYQWSYATLIKRLSGRYTDLKMNAEFHKLRNTLEANKSLCHVRLHNPNKKKSSKTKYYNPNILQQFDKHYTRKVPPKADATEPAKEVGGVFD